MDGSELLDIVDEEDYVIGKDTKENKLANGLLTRNVAVFLIDGAGKLIIAKRSLKKRSFPGRYDASAVGNVRSGESYGEAACRELLEEMGVVCSLELMGKMRNEFVDDTRTLRYLTSIFLGVFAGEIKPSEEISETVRMSVNDLDLALLIDAERFTPGFVSGYRRFRDRINEASLEQQRKA